MFGKFSENVEEFQKKYNVTVYQYGLIEDNAWAFVDSEGEILLVHGRQVEEACLNYLFKHILHQD